jgi:hypothetical protein
MVSEVRTETEIYRGKSHQPLNIIKNLANLSLFFGSINRNKSFITTPLHSFCVLFSHDLELLIRLSGIDSTPLAVLRKLLADLTSPRSKNHPQLPISSYEHPSLISLILRLRISSRRAEFRLLCAQLYRSLTPFLAGRLTRRHSHHVCITIVTIRS